MDAVSTAHPREPVMCTQGIDAKYNYRFRPFASGKHTPS